VISFNLAMTLVLLTGTLGFAIGYLAGRLRARPFRLLWPANTEEDVLCPRCLRPGTHTVRRGADFASMGPTMYECDACGWSAPLPLESRRNEWRATWRRPTS
jgi:predicted RNA-binding Zn-ribbon protein involved in translation (DUF1610 family)